MPLRPSIQIDPDEAELMLRGLVAVDLEQMRRLRPMGAPRVQDLIASGRLRYSSFDPAEQWQTYRQIIDDIARYGSTDADCEDLASLVAAEYQYEGVDMLAGVHVYRTGPRMSHVVTMRGDGSLEDPSLAAGMGSGA